MKQFRLFLIIVATTVAAFAAAATLLIWMSPTTLRDATRSFSLGSKPRGLLKTRGVPEGAYNLSGISASNPT